MCNLLPMLLLLLSLACGPQLATAPRVKSARTRRKNLKQEQRGGTTYNMDMHPDMRVESMATTDPLPGGVARAEVCRERTASVTCSFFLLGVSFGLRGAPGDVACCLVRCRWKQVPVLRERLTYIGRWQVACAPPEGQRHGPSSCYTDRCQRVVIDDFFSPEEVRTPRAQRSAAAQITDRETQRWHNWSRSQSWGWQRLAALPARRAGRRSWTSTLVSPGPVAVLGHAFPFSPL